MRKEDMVCTLEQAKKIHNAGSENLSTLFVWGKGPDNIYKLQLNIEYCGDSEYCSFIPAYTVAELGMMAGKFFLEIYKSGPDWKLLVEYYDELGIPDTKTFCRYTEAQARADALIWLIENKHVKVEDLKL